MSTRLTVEQYTVRIEIANSTAGKMRVWIEPWTFEYWLLPEESLVLVLRGPKAGIPRLRYEKDVIIYEAWAGSVVAVYKNGELISHTLEECPPEPFPISEAGIRKTLRYLGEA